MQTKIIPIPPEEGLEQAAQCLQAGGLVAFPTETVYGLGANALDHRAVAAIFTAKGRPSDNPLIIHIAQMEELGSIAAHISQTALDLGAAFWPGPLTMVLRSQPNIPLITRGGLDTVAVRIPDHQVALALIKKAELPLAGPSANLSGRPSPTTAQHVWEDMAGKIPIIIDSGPTGVGVESTVVDLTTDPPVILRPGGVSWEELSQVCPVDLDPGVWAQHPLQGPVRSPGMKYSHYAPQAKVYLVEGDDGFQVSKKVGQLARHLHDQGHKVGILATQQAAPYYQGDVVLIMGDRQDPIEIAARLFSCLRSFDTHGVDVIVIEGIPMTGLGLAVMNRLRKAAGYNIVEAKGND